VYGNKSTVKETFLFRFVSISQVVILQHICRFRKMNALCKRYWENIIFETLHNMETHSKIISCKNDTAVIKRSGLKRFLADTVRVVLVCLSVKLTRRHNPGFKDIRYGHKHVGEIKIISNSNNCLPVKLVRWRCQTVPHKERCYDLGYLVWYILVNSMSTLW